MSAGRTRASEIPPDTPHCFWVFETAAHNEEQNRGRD